MAIEKLVSFMRAIGLVKEKGVVVVSIFFFFFLVQKENKNKKI